MLKHLSFDVKEINKISKSTNPSPSLDNPLLRM